MKQKKYAAAVMTGIYVGVLTLILIFVNIIVAQLPAMRIDLTSSGQYSLSEATKRVVGRLDDRVKVEVYFTKELPAPYNRHAAYLRDLLEEYTVYAKGNLAFEFIDPGADDAKKREMMMKGVIPVQIQEVRDDQIGIKQAFMGVVITYGTKKSAIPVVRETENLEYELTSIIKKLTATDVKTVAFSAGHGEPQLTEKMQRAHAELQKNYTVVTHDFKTAKEIPQNVSSLVIAGPTEKWSDEALFYLDQFIMRGGTVAFLLNDVKVDLRQLTNAQDLDHGLYDILASYGVTPERNLIVDPQCSRINVETQQGGFRIRNVVSFPYFPSITDLNRNHILTREIGSLTLPFASSLSIAPDKANLAFAILARTSEKSWQEKSTYTINPLERKVRPQNAAAGPFNVAVAVSGKFTSFFADKAEKAKENGLDYIKDPASVLKESPETRILVVGNGSMPQDEFGDQGAAVFFVNAIDWLAQDSDMVKIRNRGLSDKPIPELSAAKRQFVRYGNMLGVPLLFVLFGIARRQWRKARLRNFKL
jgi:gliding-associated putative ABC transporter substrate-binding component GldG